MVTIARQRSAAGLAPKELARTRFDLVVASVLLDAGAGDAWRYRQPGTAETYAGSEGLALANSRSVPGCRRPFGPAPENRSAPMPRR